MGRDALNVVLGLLFFFFVVLVGKVLAGTVVGDGVGMMAVASLDVGRNDEAEDVIEEVETRVDEASERAEESVLVKVVREGADVVGRGEAVVERKMA